MSCTRHRDRPRERTAHEPLDARERWVWLERLRLERLRPEWRQRSGLRLSSGRWGGSTTGGRQLAATASRAGSMPDPSACDATRREQQSSVGAAAAHQHRSPAGVAAARRRGTKHAPFSRRRRRSTSRSFPSAFCRARKLLALGKGFRKWPGDLSERLPSLATKLEWPGEGGSVGSVGSPRWEAEAMGPFLRGPRLGHARLRPERVRARAAHRALARLLRRGRHNQHQADGADGRDAPRRAADAAARARGAAARDRAAREAARPLRRHSGQALLRAARSQRIPVPQSAGQVAS
jgi:hypothetical protein